jgi:biopolymer transport protein ExbB
MIEILFAPLQSIEVFMQTGGTVLYWIFGAGVLLWTLILERYWFFGRVFPRLRATLRQRWAQRPERRSWSARRIRAVMIGDATLQMGLIAICPLLGLLGTVTGMIEVFDVMALDGTADARAMAAGVSRATVPTMAGMMVGLSGLFFINRFQKRVKIESERLGDALAYQ